MLNHWLLFFVCLLVGALGENVVSSVSYALSRPNAKNLVYTDRYNTLSVTVSVASFAKDDSLDMYFTTAEGKNSLTVYPMSACRSTDGTPVFAFYDDELTAVSTITTATTCTFNGAVEPSNTYIVYSRLGYGKNHYDVPSFTTASASFTTSWSSRVYSVGETGTLSVKSAIPFATKDSFTITAANGTPFVSASACTNQQGVELFSVSAQGSRLLFSTRAALTTGQYTCTIQIVLGLTHVSEDRYVLTAPDFGLRIETGSPVVTLLDTDTFHPRLGLVGTVGHIGGRYYTNVASVPDAIPEAKVADAAGAVPVAADSAVAPRVSAAASPAASASASARKPSSFMAAVSAHKAKREARRAAKVAGKADSKRVRRSKSKRQAGSKRVQRSKTERQAAAAKGKKFLTATAAKSSVRAAAVGAVGASTIDFDNAMYIGIPASAVRVGDTIKLYFSQIEGIALGACTRKDGAVLGQPQLVFEEYDVTDSWLTAYVTLTAAPQVSADNYAELYCHFTIVEPLYYSLGIGAVGVRNGVFGTMPFKRGKPMSDRDFFDFPSRTMIASYSPELTRVKVEMALKHADTYTYFNADLTIHGLSVTDLATLREKCVFESEADDQNNSFSGVTVVDGVVHVKMDHATLLSHDGWAMLSCELSLPVGTTVSVFDNAVNKQILSDTAHEGTLRLTYGDDVHTHFMARDAAVIPPLFPVSFDASNLYVKAGADLGFNSIYLSLTVPNAQIDHAPIDNSDYSFTLECSKGAVHGSSAFDYDEYYYTSLSVYLDGFDAKCSGFAAALPTESSNTASADFTITMILYKGYAYEAKFPKAVPLVVKTPQIVSKEQFSFLHGENGVYAGESTTFTVGHTLLAKDASFTLHFDHDVEAVGSACTVGSDPATNVLTCTRAENKRSLTCVKVHADVTAACELDVTFASDFARTLNVTASFTGLPADMVFAPAFSIEIKKATSSVLASVLSLGTDMSITSNLPRAARTTDVLKFDFPVFTVGELQFSHFEPSTADTSGVATVDGTTITVPLTLLNTATADKTVKVHFRHILAAPALQDSYVSVSVYANDVSVGDYSAYLSPSAYTIARVPSAVSTLYNIVALKHNGMAAGDTITFNNIALGNGANAILLCDDTDPITVSGNTFTITSTLTQYQACYVSFSAYTLQKPYWSVTFTALGVATTVRVKASTAEVPLLSTVDTDDVYIKDIATTASFEIHDFTTGFLDEDSTITFAYAPAVMSMQKVECSLASSKVQGTIANGVVTVPMTPTAVSFSAIRDLVCTLSFTPLAGAAAPKLTNVAVLDSAVPDFALPTFQADYVPSLTLDVSNSAIRVFKATYGGLQFQFRQMATAVGDTITLIHSLPDGVLDVSYCETGVSKISNDVFRITTAVSDVLPVKAFSCYGTFLYVSETPVPIKVRYTSGDVSTDFDAVLPPSYAQRLLLDLVSQEVGKLTYRLTRRDAHVATSDPQGYSDQIYIGGAYNYDTTRLETDCPASDTYERYFYFIYGMPKGMDQFTCLITVWIDQSYVPSPESDTIYIAYPPLDSYGSMYEYLPALQSTRPALSADVSFVSTQFYFANADANTITVTNVWKMQASATHPIAIRSYADNAEVGKLVASADGKLLTGSFNAGAVTVANGKYTLNSPCYFNTTGTHGVPLFTTSAMVKFAVGSLSHIGGSSYFGIDFYGGELDPIFTPGSPYSATWVSTIVGNTADVVVDYSNTALTSVQACYVAVDYTSEEVYVPISVKTKGSSFSFTLSEENTLKTPDETLIALRCVFNTFSEAELRKKAATLTNTISFKMVTSTGFQLLSKLFPVAVPHVTPKTALTHSASFSRSTLFDSTEIAALAKAYAAGLRSVVASLKDSQVVVSSQRLHHPVVSLAVPNPITSLFVADSTDDGTVTVAFTVTPTDEVPIELSDINAAATAIGEAFTATGLGEFTLNASPEETIVDGACDFRCGLGCSLCVEGASCSAHMDCIDGNCNSDKKCRGDNAAPTATISLAVLAVIAAALFF